MSLLRLAAGRPLCCAPLLLLLLGSAPAIAQPLAPIEPPPGVRLEQRLDAQLPLVLPFVDSQGRAAPLGASFGDRPVLLVPGDLRCPQLCGLVMHGLLEALQRSGLARTDYRIVRVGLDPADTPATARTRRDADLSYAQFLQGGEPVAQPLDLRVLTGDVASIERLAAAAGFHFERVAADGDDPAARFAHPTTVIVATPLGRVSQYLMGVQFDPAELRLALVSAAGGRIGSLSERIALLCAHFDPTFGRHSAAVLWLLRAMGLALVLLLAGLWWRQQRQQQQRLQAQGPGTP